MRNPFLLHEPTAGCWLAFREPLAVVAATKVEEILPALEEVTRRTARDSLWAVGFLRYEAAPAFDSAFITRAPEGDRPLLYFALVPSPERLQPRELESLLPPTYFRLGEVRPSVSRREYLEAIGAIHRHIEAGDSYQVNYTLRLEASFEGDPRGLFREMAGAQEPPYAAYLEWEEGRHALCSASPELFFRFQEGRLLCQPMKGTAARGRTLAEDEGQRQWLAASAKNRAENVMIVDMVRNDLGRIARPGSVQAPELFAVERYPSVWQMTSTVTAEPFPGTGLVEILQALFPCASITGAPKASTLGIITELETTPRGVYTGAIGYLAPDGSAQMSVAIRTAEVDREAGVARYGVGGGIVWDSIAEEEYEECRVKALALPRRDPRNGHSRRPPRDFQLLETLLWDPGHYPGNGFFLLEYHLRRQRNTATYFAYPFPEEEIRQALGDAVAELPHRPHRCRLLVGRHGEVTVETYPLDQQTHLSQPMPLALAEHPIDSNDPFLFHKTTHRRVYEEARPATKPAAAGEAEGKLSGRATEPASKDTYREDRPERSGEPEAQREEKLDAVPGSLPGPRPDHTDIQVLLWNEKGEVTEGVFANLVYQWQGKRYTPPVECGLLAGTYREWLLERGEIEERTLRIDELPHCEALWLINSVRGEQEATLH